MCSIDHRARETCSASVIRRMNRFGVQRGDVRPYSVGDYVRCPYLPSAWRPADGVAPGLATSWNGWPTRAALADVVTCR